MPSGEPGFGKKGDMDTEKQQNETSELLHNTKKPCRSCVDFKTYMKQTNKDLKKFKVSHDGTLTQFYFSSSILFCSL